MDADDSEFLQSLFPELHEADQDAERDQRAKEELSEMKPFRSERKNFAKSELAQAWAESRKSGILWVDGYQLLSRVNFNASFVLPLVQLVEGNFGSVITIRHFCKAQGQVQKSSSHLLMMQDLVTRLLRQNPSVAQRKKSSITKENTSTTPALWDLFSELLEEVQAQCVLLIIGGIDSLVEDDLNARNNRTEMIDRLQSLTETRLVKVIPTLGLPQPQAPTVESISSLTIYRHRGATKRTISFDSVSMQNSLPVLSLQLAEIQEKRCQRISFVQLPMIYTLGSIIYTQNDKHLQACVVSELSGMEQVMPGTFAPLRIRAWSIDHNQTYLCKRLREFEVPFFPGHRQPSLLKYVPAGYLPDEVATREKLIERGRVYWSMASGVHHRLHDVRTHFLFIPSYVLPQSSG